MKLDRLSHDPGALADFFDEALTARGALCERTWYDRVQVIADGAAARLWNSNASALHEVELHFTSADSTAPRDAAREVFPGCPLTFQLAETLRPVPLPLDRVVLESHASARPPAPEVGEKLWRAQFPDTARWRLETPLAAAHHFSLVSLLRCEIQAIDQHWSLHRLALSLPDGVPDDSLAAALDFTQIQREHAPAASWPGANVPRWRELIEASVVAELADDLAAIRARQENYLRRELDRIEAYFDNYERELTARATRGSASTRLKADARLAAARAEHARRRADQVARHEIRVHPHIDALLLVAEPAWRATISTVRGHETRSETAHFVPRARCWFVE